MARRSQIVDCAIETIAELGYSQASVRKIADRVGDYHSRTGQCLHELSVDLAPEQLADLAKLELEAIFEHGADSGGFRSLSPVSMALAVRSAIGGALLKSTTDPDFDVRAYGEDLVTALLLAAENR